MNINLLRHNVQTTLLRGCFNILMTMLCLVVASCDKDTSLQNVADDNAIGFQTAVETTTRADQTDLERDGFSVWGGYVTSGAINNVFTGTTISYDAVNGWTYSPAKYWVPGKVYNFFGVYPRQNETTVVPFLDNGNLYYTLDFNIPANAATDLLVATPTSITAAKPYPTVNMEFNHALSKININVQKNGANDEDEVIVYSVSFNNIKRTGKFNSKTKQWGETTAGALTFSNLNKTLSHTEHTKVVSDKLLMPQEIAANSIQLSIYYSIRTGSSIDFYTANADLPVSTITQWDKQTIYTYNVTLGAAKNDILFGVPEVQDWFDKLPIGGSIMIQ